MKGLDAKDREKAVVFSTVDGSCGWKKHEEKREEGHMRIVESCPGYWCRGSGCRGIVQSF